MHRSAPMSSVLRGVAAAATQVVAAQAVRVLPVDAWQAMDAAITPLRQLDALATGRSGLLPPGVPPPPPAQLGLHHQYLDSAVNYLRGEKDYFYSEGLGRSALLPRFAREMASLGGSASAINPPPLSLPLLLPLLPPSPPPRLPLPPPPPLPLPPRAVLPKDDVGRSGEAIGKLST